jgi:hypothetical protein
MTRVSAASVGRALIFQWSFSSYRKLRMLFTTVVSLVVGWGVDVVGVDDLGGMVMRLRRGRRRCGRGGVGVCMMDGRAVLVEATGVAGSWRRRSDAESGEVRGTMKVGGMAADSAVSSVSGLSRMMSSIDGWSATGASDDDDELSTGAGAGVAADVVAAAVAGGGAAAVFGAGSSSVCCDSSGVVAFVDDRTMNWLSDVLLVSVLAGCVMNGKWVFSSSSVEFDVSRMKAMRLFSVGCVVD